MKLKDSDAEDAVSLPCSVEGCNRVFASRSARHAHEGWHSRKSKIASGEYDLVDTHRCVVGGEGGVQNVMYVCHYEGCGRSFGVRGALHTHLGWHKRNGSKQSIQTASNKRLLPDTQEAPAAPLTKYAAEDLRMAAAAAAKPAPAPAHRESTELIFLLRESRAGANGKRHRPQHATDIATGAFPNSAAGPNVYSTLHAKRPAAGEREEEQGGATSRAEAAAAAIAEPLPRLPPIHMDAPYMAGMVPLASSGSGALSAGWDLDPNALCDTSWL